jgi:hypothetical protein
MDGISEKHPGFQRYTSKERLDFLIDSTPKLFTLTNQHIQEKIATIESKIDYEQPTKSNLEIMIDDSLMIASQLNVVWDRSDLENKKIMSRTLFPDGVIY